MHDAITSPVAELSGPPCGTIAWATAAVSPLALAGLAEGVGPTGGATTWIGAVTIAVAVCAAYVDGRWQRLPNWLTYPAAGWGLTMNALATYSGPDGAWIGGVGLRGSLAGFAVLFTGMLMVFSLTGGGAGDVKLSGAIGALLGLEAGSSAMIYAFVAAGLWVVGVALSKLGPLTLAQMLLNRLANAVLPGWVPAWAGSPDPERARSVMRSRMALGPFFAIGILLTLATS